MSSGVRVLLACVLASGAGLAAACLPSLLPLYDVDAGSPAPVQTPPGCGDGIIATLDDGGDAGESCDPGQGSALGCSSTCQISCGGQIGPDGHCYFFADPSDYNGARDNCNAAGGHIVTIGTPEESKLVADLVEMEAGGAPYRIGLSKEDVENAWSTNPLHVEEPGWPVAANTCAGCFAVGADRDSGAFGSLADGGEAPCLVARGQTWLQGACGHDAGLVTVCEREPVGQRAQSCGGPFCLTVPVTAGKKRYIVSISPATADAADAFCKSFPGGSLVILGSRAEREELTREIRALVPSEENARRPLDVWIGLTKQGDDWIWDDGVATTDPNRDPPWGNLQPAPTPSGRAFLRFDSSSFSKLAASTGGDTKKLFACQRGAGP